MSLPDPLAVAGAVAVDRAGRTITVIPAGPGYAAMMWANGIEKMERGADRVPTVWARSAGGGEAGRPGVPVAGTLQFRFPPGDPAWAELLGTPRLSAIVTVDRKAGHILGVKFRRGRG